MAVRAGGGAGEAAAVGYVLWAVMVGTTVPNALWGWYQAEWGLSATTVSAVFAAYAAAVVGSLLGWGSMADRRGPWTPLRWGVVASASASAVSIVDGVPALFAGRVLAGASVGLVSGAAVAALTRTHPRGPGGAARVSTFATMAGLASGPLVAALVLEATTSTADAAYLAHLVTVVPVLGWLWRAPEGRSATERRRRSGRVAPDRVFVAAAVAGFAANAQLGLYAVLTPTLLVDILDENSLLLSGVAGCLLFASAGTAQLATAHLSTTTRLGASVTSLVGGAGVVTLAMDVDSVPLLLAAVGLGGLGAGLAFGEGLDGATRSAPPERRAAVSSTWFVVAYLGLVGPVLGAGALAERVGATAAAALIGAVATVAVTGASLVLRRAPELSDTRITTRKDVRWTHS
nr:MFS transporter [Nocardioides thalensis]